MATAGQIRLIKTAKSKSGVSDEDYADILKLLGVDSCKYLDNDGVDNALKIFEKFGFEYKKSDNKLRWSEFDGRDNEFASGKQLRMLEGMFMSSPKVQSKKLISFFHLVKRIAHVDYPGWLLKADVKKVKKAIETIE